MSADLYFTGILLLLSFFLFFVSCPRSSLNGTQPYPATWPEVSVIWKCMSEIWSIFFPPSFSLFPSLSGAQKPSFWRFPNLRASLTAYIFRTKHDIHNHVNALTTTRVSYIVSKCHELLSTNGFKLDPNFYPLYVNSSTSSPGFANGHQQTELNQTLINCGR